MFNVGRRTKNAIIQIPILSKVVQHSQCQGAQKLSLQLSDVCVVVADAIVCSISGGCSSACSSDGRFASCCTSGMFSSAASKSGRFSVSEVAAAVVVNDRIRIKMTSSTSSRRA